MDDEADSEVRARRKALDAKYRAERDRRVRADGAAQYLRPSGAYARYLDDPYVEPGFTRAPVHDDVDAVIVGAGLGGLLAAARLRQAGVKDIRIIEKAGDVGGTWYWNRYPGCACDVESYIYMPLLEELAYTPTRKYAPAPEIAAHCKAIARHFDLYDLALFQTEVTDVTWREDTARWTIRTDRDDAFTAKYVVVVSSRLHRPQLPGAPGIETFRGRSFHTSRWDYAYTGGDHTGGLTGLTDKRVGIVGTGATAVQAVPHLGAWAKELYVFQRTPAPVDVRNDRPTDMDWARSLPSGWQKDRMANFNLVTTGQKVDADLIDDGWTDLVVNVRLAAQRRIEAGEMIDDPAAIVQLADDARMERMRERIDRVVQDRATAEALKPWYAQACKRPCFHDEYFPTFNRPNVTLVDTRGKGLQRVTETGVIAGDREYPLDCLIFATGFTYNDDYTDIIGFDITGRGGLRLSEKWKDGAATLHGLTSRGFPNCFIVSATQAGHAVNFQYTLDLSSTHIAYIVSQAEARQARTLEPTAEAEAAWVDVVVAETELRSAVLAECTPGYLNNEGKVDMRARRNSQYFKGPVAFQKVLEDWRAEGTMPGMELG